MRSSFPPPSSDSSFTVSGADATRGTATGSGRLEPLIGDAAKAELGGV
jgi:hypothetical protein